MNQAKSRQEHPARQIALRSPARFSDSASKYLPGIAVFSHNSTFKAKSRQELLLWISKVSFMAYDMALYLDTHPDDTQALEFFQKYSQMRRQALAQWEDGRLVLYFAKDLV